MCKATKTVNQTLVRRPPEIETATLETRNVSKLGRPTDAALRAMPVDTSQPSAGEASWTCPRLVETGHAAF